MIATINMKYGLVLYFIFLSTMAISCSDENRRKENATQITNEYNAATRLKFTTGVRSILEDSKGDIWFGSYQEGVGVLHNGRLSYFTTEN